MREQKVGGEKLVAMEDWQHRVGGRHGTGQDRTAVEAPSRGDDGGRRGVEKVERVRW